jgi:phage gp37-like protein
MHPFAQLEEAVLTALAPLKHEGLKTLDVYAGQLEVKKLEELQALIPSFPAIYVISGELITPEKETQGHMAEMAVTLLVADQNRRGARETLRGDAMSPGIYFLLERCQDYLHHQKLIQGWRSLRVRREGVLVYAPQDNICLFEALYTTQF